MKKAIPILLIVFLCLLVAFSAVCEYRQQHPEPEELRLSFDANSAYRFRNAKGETLEYDDLDFSGDMQIIDSVLGGVDSPPYFYLTLPYSKRLEADFVDGGPDAYVRVSTDLALWGVEGSGVQRAVFTGSGIETTGENMEYSVRFFHRRVLSGGDWQWGKPYPLCAERRKAVSHCAGRCVYREV